VLGHLRRRTILQAGLAGAAGAIGVKGGISGGAGGLALTRLTVIDVNGGPPIRDATVIIRNGRITAVGPRREAPLPPDVTVVDLPGKFLIPGLADMHDEMAELVRAGFTPLEALRAATSEPARFLGRLDTSGTVDRGKDADLVVLDADPLRDIRNTQRIHAVVLRGRLISADQRRRLLSDVEAAAQVQPATTAPAACACTGAVRMTKGSLR
jgi:imidazolonepropionase-like amidohydrolase